MAQMGTMPLNRAKEAVPGFLNDTNHSTSAKGVFPDCSNYGLASDITGKDTIHWKDYSTAIFGTHCFQEIIVQLETLRFAKCLLQQVNQSDSINNQSECIMLSKGSCPKTQTFANAEDSTDSGNNDSLTREAKNLRAYRFKEAHRNRKLEEDIHRDESRERIRRYSSDSFEKCFLGSDNSRERLESDPIEGGPIRSQLFSLRHQPYSVSEERLSRSPRNSETVTLESTAEEILRDKEYSEKLNPCLDQLESTTEKNPWNPYQESRILQENVAMTSSSVNLPSIVIDDPREEPFIDVFSQKAFTASQIYPKPRNPSTSCSPGKTWTDSSSSKYNIIRSSGSLGSSPVQSPGLIINLESPAIHNISCSSIDSPRLAPNMRIPQGLSSSESSNHSDAPSPLSYQSPLNSRLETQLGNEIRGLLLWNDKFDSSETMMDNTTIDNNEMQLVEEVLRDLGKTNENEEPQVVPRKNQQVLNTLYTEEEKETDIVNETVSPDFLSFSSSYDERSFAIRGNSNFQYECTRLADQRTSGTDVPILGSPELAYGAPAKESNLDIVNISPKNSLDEFDIPPMVASFESSQTPRNCERSVLPWHSLNLPSVRSSERLKEGLNPKEVEKAMGNLLKRTVEELAKSDEDGDTMLMCLVGNPEEFAKKKAYLAPLVERLSNTRDALCMTNNRGEDALYLAAMNCPQTPYVAGYLAAAMLRKGIDISQTLYHTRGDTLIHSVAGRGDSHGEVLAELLALRTLQGNAVFDLSKRNYDGKTALHIAVESHVDSSRTTGISSVAIVQLLLENGAEINIKKTNSEDTPLHSAVSISCDPMLVKILLNYSTMDVVNARNSNQDTALHIAAAASNSINSEKQKEVCWLLIQTGAEISLQNRYGKTPLDLVSPDRRDLMRHIFYK